MIEHPDQDQIVLYVAGQLDSSDAEVVRTHLQTGCPICAGRTAEAEAIVSLLDQAAPLLNPGNQLYNKLQESLSSGRADVRRSKSPRRRSLLLLTHLACSAVAAGLATLLVLRATAPARDLLDSKHLQLVHLTGAADRPAARGHVLWDHEHNRWEVTVFDLVPPPPGKTYELWFVTADQQKRRAALFTTGTDQKAVFFVDVPRDLTQLAVAAITPEPASGSEQPTGPIVLAGEIGN